MKQEMLGIRRVRKDEGGNLEPEIVTNEPIGSAGRKKVVLW